MAGILRSIQIHTYSHVVQQQRTVQLFSYQVQVLRSETAPVLNKTYDFKKTVHYTKQKGKHAGDRTLHLVLSGSASYLLTTRFLRDSYQIDMYYTCEYELEVF